MRRIKYKAFTIIELLVVLVIIGIFSAIAYPNVSSWIADREVRKEVYDVVNLINERKITLNLIERKAKLKKRAK